MILQIVKDTSHIFSMIVSSCFRKVVGKRILMIGLFVSMRLFEADAMVEMLMRMLNNI
ncbi:MAG: hypothetical protein LKI76_09115 [Megasphaera sp.]|jgi:hypothetical protein|uniref:Uncharacterized protein n=1 Tax=Megasphaera paucivorans TaxID=349095 RepID=A0A1H0BVP2_9FIRM|nr:hypothetical protein [Megasphaera paucivorans]MCI1822062.1 hypothetical protein [Megasphaera sp.]MCI1824075.1 hypothetical protein [Megasphaera sp.]SDN49721.1 hypothetical protein SAMN05660299_02804 [Megasphaera paucivorans]